jgi:ABC-2 type transport system permease protein
MMKRHLYLFAKSWPRVLSLVYYPSLQIVLWGLVSQYLAPSNDLLKDMPGLFLSAVLLWELLMRAQLGVNLSFFEELYARNLANLFVAPLRTWEYVVSLLLMSTLRTIIAMLGTALMAWLMFRFQLGGMGLSMVCYAALLMMFAWAVGFAVCALVLRLGLGAEELAWGLIFLLLPISCVYYPLATLPEWLQAIALAFPAAHVFEAMRLELSGKGVQWGHLLSALWLNLIYLAAALAVFLAAIRRARQDGQLLQMGE